MKTAYGVILFIFMLTYKFQKIHAFHIELLTNVIGTGKDLYDLVQQHGQEEKQEELIKNQKKFINHIKDVETSLKMQSEYLKDALEHLKEKNNNENEKTKKLFENIYLINAAYTDFESYSKNTYERSTIEEFSQHAISSNFDSVKRALFRIKLNLQNNEEIFNCKPDELKMQILKRPAALACIELFNDILATDLKGQIILLYAYNQLKIFGKGNFTIEIADVQKKAKIREKVILTTFSNVLRTCDLLFWNAMVPKWDKKGHTYDEITRLIQGFIQNEENLNADKSCGKTCDEYSKSGMVVKSGPSCDKRICNGRIIDCTMLSQKLIICPSGSNSNRRYEFVKSDGHNLGSVSVCPNNECTVSSWQSWFYRCDYCVCLCDSAGRLSDRYFSLREVTSDINSNKVITGIRIIKKNRMFQFQIEEASLKKYGEVEQKQWKEVDNFQITQDNVIQGRDYLSLNYTTRRIDLDTIKIPENFVVTGVQFALMKGVLKLSIRGTEYNFKSGSLNSQNNTWYLNSLAKYKIPNDNLNVPTKDGNIPIRRRRNVRENAYISFTHTGIKVDVAQTTVPFIDIREVSGEGPLQGLGLYYKESRGYGGFIAPSVVLYNYSLISPELLKQIN